MSAEQGAVTVPITGRVDAALIHGLIQLGDELKRAGQESETAGRKTESAQGAWEATADRVKRAAEAYVYCSEALDDMGRRIDGVLALAAEQEHLDAATAATGLNFDEAAAAAGRFADETSVLHAVERARSSEILLTQPEINALFRVAGAHSRELGLSVDAASQQLVEALIRGKEGGLERFGQGLADVAGQSHSVEERLQVLVREASRTAEAQDDAADAAERLRDSFDDYKRTAADAFVNELVRLNAVGTSFGSTRDSAADLTTKVTAFGQTLANVATRAVAGLTTIKDAFVLVGSAIGETLGLVDRATVAANSRAFGASVNRLEALDDDTGAPTPTEPSAPTGPTTAQQAASHRARTSRGSSGHHRQHADMTFTLQDGETEAMTDDERRIRAQEDRLRTAEESRRAALAANERRHTEEHLQQLQQAEQARADMQRQLDAHVAARDPWVQGREAVRAYANEVVNAGDLVRTALDSASQAMGSHIDAWVGGKESIGDAAEGMAHDIMAAQAKTYSMKAGGEFAEALASLAILDFRGAGLHAAAGVGFVAAAGVFGAAAQATAPAAPSSSGGSSSGRSSQPASVAPRASSATGGPTNITVVFGGPMYGTGGVRQAAREIAGLLNAGARQGGVQLDAQLVTR